MATNVKRPIEGSAATGLDQMPPIRVTTEGIPAEEHLEVPLAAASAPTKTPRGQRASRLAWALAGILGLILIVGVGVVAYVFGTNPSQDVAHMGLTTQAWQEYRVGERAEAPLAMGLTPQAWREYRSGERLSGTEAHMGLAVPAWLAYREGERTA